MKRVARIVFSLLGALGGLGAAMVAIGTIFAWMAPNAVSSAAPVVPATHAAPTTPGTAESPLLADLVAAGRLPPKPARVGADPLVRVGPDGPGRYGGTWFRASDSLGQALFDLSFRLAGATLVRWSADGRRIEPALARNWRPSADYRRWEFSLRPGVRWSDGAPLTTRDVEYMYRNEIMPELAYAPGGLLFRGQLGRLQVLDDLRFVVEFDEPNPLMLERLASDYEGLAQPAHYLARYHPTLGDPRFLEEEMRRRGAANRRQLYAQVRQLDNPEHPRLWPWIIRERPLQSPVKAVRNPYYWVVDGAGRQLPYLDQVVIDVRAPRMIPLAAGHGQLTFQEQFLDLRDYSYLRSMAARGLCRLYDWQSPFSCRWILYPNLNRRVAVDDPGSSWKAMLLGDRRFRQAVSLALDREELIHVSNLGLGEPAQISPPMDSLYYSAALRAAYTTHDPGRAGRLLDELGLTRRDGEGFRTFPDNSRMVWYVDWNDGGGTPPALLVEQLRQVGLRFVLRQRSLGLFGVDFAAGRQDFVGDGSYPDTDPGVFPMAFLPTTANCYYAYQYGVWFAAGGLWSKAPTKMGIEPPRSSRVRQALELYDTLIRTPDAAGRQHLFAQIAGIAAEELWTIAVLPRTPALVVASPALRNVPLRAVEGFWQATPANAGAEAYFLAGAETEPNFARWYQSEFSSPNVKETTATTQSSGSFWRSGLGLLALLGIGYVAFRNRFVARRLAVMVPALVIVSVTVFAIVQWPPGSFVESKKLQLAASGRDYGATEIRLLEEQFHLTEPQWKQYLRWSGVYWFGSFRSADRGLLQGELGRSMETGRPIADLLGDRLLITVVLALATLILTWVVALPLGLLSAARAGGWCDQAIAFAGFLAISIPGFLLALLLLFVGNHLFGSVAVGLFSPEYTAQPGWSVGKMLDLLRNLWVPLIVLGLAGTAGMIRLLRANVLEELRKPYVLAARARGLRPARLLVKYPLKVALNPFASGMGSIFPYLVSGEVIVATLLCLPTIGPLLLSALLSQDVYLAASVIMLLTMLAMAGTLVSDLLLVWLDPRIRLGGMA